MRQITGLLACLLLVACAAPRPFGTDCHMHVTPEPELFSMFPEDSFRARSALEGAGLERGCILSPGFKPAAGCQSTSCPDQRAWTERANDWTLAEARKDAGLIPFCGVPLEVDWGVAEVRRCAANGARGLKLHPVSQGLTLTDAAAYASLDAVAQAAGEVHLPILIHIAFTDEEAGAFYRLAAARPGTTFILAHQLGPKIAEIVKAPKNVYIDISGIVLVPRSAGTKFVALWRKVGMERILLGSDWPTLHPSEYVSLLRGYPLTSEERRLVLGDNARRLFP